MGKASAKAVKKQHDPLQTQLKEDVSGVLRTSSKSKRRKAAVDADDDPAPAGVSGTLSKKILQMAREQQAEEAQGEEETNNLAGPSKWNAPQSISQTDAGEDDDVWSDDGDDLPSGDEDEDIEYDDLEIDEEDQAALEAFMPQSNRPGLMLADLVMEKIQDHEERQLKKVPGTTTSSMPVQNAKVIEVYTQVGQLLSRYKSGPLPKAFKILPTLSAWPSLLELTSPETWTPHATYAATRIFASNLDPKQSQRFYRDFLLPRMRDEIAETKKLAVQTYTAIKKSLYKPAAFFKGILFPLCQSGTCTLKEAAILGSIITRVSIPVLHSGAALLKLAEMDYTGPNSLFIRILLDKKYALPYKVVDALVFHFIRFKRDPRVMPVLWHQSLLVFAQRYKSDITSEQREAILDVVKVKSHAQITPEIRRELMHSVARDEVQDVDMGDW